MKTRGVRLETSLAVVGLNQVSVGLKQVVVGLNQVPVGLKEVVVGLKQVSVGRETSEGKFEKN